MIGVMPNTGERREISARVNAKEAEVIQESTKLSAKTEQESARMDQQHQLRITEHNPPQPKPAKPEKKD
jgi:hypothetical protein